MGFQVTTGMRARGRMGNGGADQEGRKRELQKWDVLRPRQLTRALYFQNVC